MKAFWYRLNSKERRLLLVLMGILAYGIVDFTINYESYQAALSGEDPYVATDLWDTLKTDSSLHNIQEDTYQIQERHWRIDPFQLKQAVLTQKSPSTMPVIENEPSQTIILQAISLSEGQRWAIINGRVVTEADVIGNWNVVAINEGSVVVADNTGRQRILKLKVARGIQ